MIFRLSLTALLLCTLDWSFHPAVATAQEADPILLQGRVADSLGHPIAGARVTASGAEEVAVTGQDGRYRLLLSGDAAVRLRASAVGFHPSEIEIAYADAARAAAIVLQRAPYELPTITVTGTTRAEIARVAGATSIVGGTVLRDRAPVSVMDALRTVPGIQTADEDPFGLNLNVGFRGLSPRRSSRTLLLEDGVPILLGPYGDPTMHYAPPVEALARIEIIKGSGQITNGPQTAGGVINFVTRSPPTSGTYGEATLGGGARGYRNGHLWFGTGRDGYGASVDYTYREGEGVRREQGHRFHNVALNALFPLGARQSLVLKASFWEEDSAISETGLTQGEFEVEPFSLPFAAAGRFDVRRTLGQAVHEIQFGRARLQTNAYLSRTERASWRQSGESEERLGQDDYAEDFNCAPGATSYSDCGNQGRLRDYTVLGVEPRLSVDFGDGGVASGVEVGGRLYREDVRRRQFVGNAPTSGEHDAVLVRDNQIETSVVAGYLRALLGARSLTLSPGIRVEYVDQRNRNRFSGSEAAVEQSYTQFLPGVGATYGLADGITLFGGLHRGFAPPRPADIYRPVPGQPVVLVDPETSWNWEAGGRLQPMAGLSAEATFFRIDFGNQIIEAPAGAGQRFTNGGRTLHQGVELGGLVSLATLYGWPDDLTLNASFTYLPVARFQSGDEREAEIAGNRLPYAPRRLASAGATVGHRSGFTFGSSLEHTGDQFADDENTVVPSDDGQNGLLPSYTVTHAFASYALPGGRVNVRASVRNLFDRVYITQRNEGIYTGARRLIRGEIHWSF